LAPASQQLIEQKVDLDIMARVSKLQLDPGEELESWENLHPVDT
jgi:hypothetical protein